MAGFCVFAAFLIFTGIKLMFVSVHNHSLEDNRLLKLLRRRMNVTEGLRGNAVFVRKPDPAIGKLTRFAAPLFLPLILIELADLVFTVDSGPVVFPITTDPVVVHTSDIRAILGLRALFRTGGDLAPLRLSETCDVAASGLHHRPAELGKVPALEVA